MAVTSRYFIPFLVAAVFLLSVSMPTKSFATMYGFLDAKGVCHFRDIPEKRGKIIVIAEGLRAAASRARAARVNRIFVVDTFEDSIREAAAINKVDPLLIKAVIKVESDFDPKAISPKGARGLMQIMPATARDLRLDDPFDPRKNIIAGTKYLKRQLENFGDIRLGLAAYNAGSNLVTSQGMIIDIPETQAYVAKVLEYYRQYKNQ